jgi:hypothetical protein
MLLFLLCGLCACLAVAQTHSNLSSANASFPRGLVAQPVKHEIVMVGHRSVIKIMCDKLPQNIRLSVFLDQPLAHLQPEHILCYVNVSDASDGSDGSDSPSATTATASVSAEPGEEKSSTQHLEITGLHPGQTFLFLSVWDPADGNGTAYGELLPDAYVVTVVERVDMARDAFTYVLSMVKFLALLLLGFRMRSEAVKEVLTRPCALINALLCQVLLLPMVSAQTSSCFSRYRSLALHSSSISIPLYFPFVSSPFFLFQPFSSLPSVPRSFDRVSRHVPSLAPASLFSSPCSLTLSFALLLPKHILSLSPPSLTHILAQFIFSLISLSPTPHVHYTE